MKFKTLVTNTIVQLYLIFRYFEFELLAIDFQIKTPLEILNCKH